MPDFEKFKVTPGKILTRFLNISHIIGRSIFRWSKMLLGGTGARHCLSKTEHNPRSRVSCAADLLDMFYTETRIEQAREVSRWIRELAKVTRVAICSGNHDNAGRQISADRAPVDGWLIALGKAPKIITDGVTQVATGS